ncbi:MAG: hypothetical protein K1W11_03690, partial [Akkermansia muciniphila]
LSRESGAFASGERGKISGLDERKTIFPCSGDSGAFFPFPPALDIFGSFDKPGKNRIDLLNTEPTFISF